MGGSKGLMKGVMHEVNEGEGCMGLMKGRMQGVNEGMDAWILPSLTGPQSLMDSCS